MNAWTLATNPTLVSLQLVNDSAFAMDDLLARLIGEAIGRLVATKAVSGSGTAEPLGVITALNARGSVGTSGVGRILHFPEQTPGRLAGAPGVRLPKGVVAPLWLSRLILCPVSAQCRLSDPG